MWLMHARMIVGFEQWIVNRKKWYERAVPDARAVLDIRENLLHKTPQQRGSFRESAKQHVFRKYFNESRYTPQTIVK